MNAALPVARGPDAAGSESVLRVVIVGFMGAGKTTVGAMLAESIGWDFLDLDAEVARREGMPVPEIIRERGMADFRRVEAEVGRALLCRRRAVIAVGGGWPAEPGHMDMLGKGTVSVWLRVGTRAALERIAGSDTARPLLQVDDPVGTAESLLAERTRHYRRGDIVVDTEDRAPDEVATEILKHIKHISPSRDEPATATAAGKGQEDE